MTVPSRAGSHPRSGGLSRDPRILGRPDGRAKVALVVLAIAPMGVYLVLPARRHGAGQHQHGDGAGLGVLIAGDG